MHIDLFRVVGGAILLLFGRRLFWLFVAILGFVAAADFAAKYLNGQTQMVQLIVASIAGLIGAVLAIFLQKLAIAIAGFVAGAYAVTLLIPALHMNPGNFAWLLSVVGGIIGAVFGVAIFDWALIILSSFTGAMLIAQSVPIAGVSENIVLLVLFVIGIAIQASFHRPAPRPAAKT